MKRTFKLNTSNPLTLLCNHADFMRWKRKYGIWTTAENAPLYPVIAGFYFSNHEQNEPQYFHFEQIEDDAEMLRATYCALATEIENQSEGT